MVYLGADSMSELSNALKNVRSTSDFAEFASSVKDIRVGVNTELVQYVTSFNGE
jgi:virulence-associated protein VapD